MDPLSRALYDRCQRALPTRPGRTNIHRVSMLECLRRPDRRVNAADDGVSPSQAVFASDLMSPGRQSRGGRDSNHIGDIIEIDILDVLIDDLRFCPGSRRRLSPTPGEEARTGPPSGGETPD